MCFFYQFTKDFIFIDYYISSYNFIFNFLTILIFLIISPLIFKPGLTGVFAVFYTVTIFSPVFLKIKRRLERSSHDETPNNKNKNHKAVKSSLLSKIFLQELLPLRPVAFLVSCSSIEIAAAINGFSFHGK